MPLPLSVGKEAVIVPAPVSEEIGKSDGFVSHLHGNQEKRVGPASRDWGRDWGGEEKEWEQEGGS